MTLILLAARNVLRQTTRTVITLATIVTGVVALIVSGGFVTDTFVQLAEAVIHSQLGHIQIAAPGYFSRGSRLSTGYLLKQPTRVLEALSGERAVKDVLKRLNFSGVINNGRSDFAIIGEGVEPSKEADLGSYMRLVAGRHLSDSDRYGIMLGNGVAKSLRVLPGDHVTILVTTPEGGLNSLDFIVIGIFQTISRDYDARAVRTSLASAQELLGTDGVNVVVLSLLDTQDTVRTADRVRQRLDGRFEVRTWSELSDFYAKTVSLYRTQFGALRLIVLIMVVLGVTNSINMSIFERQAEFGTMRALGAYNSAVFKLIITEAGILGLAGAIAGAIVGVAIAMALSSIGIPMPPPPNADIGYLAKIRVEPVNVLLAMVIGTSSTLIAALWPGVKVCATPLVDALRRGT